MNSGAIWTNVVPDKIYAYMGNDTLAAAAYADPFTFATTYPYGSQPRLAVARAQDEAQVSVAGTFTARCHLASTIVFPNSLPKVEESALQMISEDHTLTRP